MDLRYPIEDIERAQEALNMYIDEVQDLFSNLYWDEESRDGASGIRCRRVVEYAHSPIKEQQIRVDRVKVVLSNVRDKILQDKVLETIEIDGYLTDSLTQIINANTPQLAEDILSGHYPEQSAEIFINCLQKVHDDLLYICREETEEAKEKSAWWRKMLDKGVDISGKFAGRAVREYMDL